MKKTALFILIMTVIFTSCNSKKSSVQLFPEKNFDTTLVNQKVSL